MHPKGNTNFSANDNHRPNRMRDHSENKTAQHPRSHSRNHQNQQQFQHQMVENINMTLNKIGGGEEKRRSVDKELKPNQKTVFNIIASFLHSFDGHFHSGMLDVDLIFEMYRLMGYPGNLHKTIFQPVGAPHTWNHCLQMLEWLSEVANLHF